MNVSSTSHRFIPCNSSPILERSLTITKNKHSMKQECLWGILNFAVLSIILYDLNNSCPLYLNYYRYGEYLLLVILTINLFYHVIKIIQLSLAFPEPLAINEEQKKLLGIKASDPNYKIIQTPTKSTSLQNSNTSTPFNISLNRISNISQYENDSLNYSMSSPSWSYMKGTPDLSSGQFSPKPSPAAKQSPNKSSFRDDSSVEFISDEDSLNKYLKEHKEIEKANKLASKQQHSSNLLSSFWSHPVTQTAKDVSEFLKKYQYQLSTPSAVKSPGSSNIKNDDKTSSPAQGSALEVWTRINVDSVALTQWNENLRMWISQTILERLVTEFDRVNSSLDKHGLSDVRIGAVGLDRLRKTAQTGLVAQFIPSFPSLIPFLEATSNQEYLERRIKDLAKGGCMSEFKWNGGGKYGGKEWDESLPTDCAVVMHLLASYLDTQLMPLPNLPDTKAFSGHHYIKVTDKIPLLTSGSLFIQEVSEKPPHYRVIVAGKTYEMVKGYNNLFHSILFFIYHVNKIEHGMLGRVNLGRAGVNILWVIDQ